MIHTFEELASKLPIGLEGHLTLTCDDVVMDIIASDNMVTIYLDSALGMGKLVKNLPNKEYLEVLLKQVFVLAQMYSITFKVGFKNGPAMAFTKFEDPKIALFLTTLPVLQKSL
jgi:hypothetical protein